MSIFWKNACFRFSLWISATSSAQIEWQSGHSIGPMIVHHWPNDDKSSWANRILIISPTMGQQSFMQWFAPMLGHHRICGAASFWPLSGQNHIIGGASVGPPLAWSFHWVNGQNSVGPTRFCHLWAKIYLGEITVWNITKKVSCRIWLFSQFYLARNSIKPISLHTDRILVEANTITTIFGQLQWHNRLARRTYSQYR